MKITQRHLFCTVMILFAIASSNQLCAQQNTQQRANEPENLAIFRKAYPKSTFCCSYDENVNDYAIKIVTPYTQTTLYWADGKFLPKEHLDKKDGYYSLLYQYADKVADPANFTDADIERIRNFSKPQNRKTGLGTPPFLYDALYDCTSRTKIESHLTRIDFLGKKSSVHEQIVYPLKRVENAIQNLAKTNTSVKDFVTTLASADSYAWRNISDSGNRSFHSLALAIDILPKGWQQKNVYWAWRRDIDGDDWMKLPLDRRWMPPDEVIEIFEKEGFIWGGKWTIWDNMHFEYHPEIILFNTRT